MTARRFPAVVVIAALGGLGRLAPIAAAEPAPERQDDAVRLVTAAAAAFAALRYDDALRLAEQAWHSGASDPEQLRRIFALAGQAAGSIGEDEAARLWFSRWLYLDPAAALPDGTSPKLTVLLRDARGVLAGAAITARAAAKSGAIAITVDGDPLALVAAVRAGATSVAVRDHAATLPVPAERREVELVDRYGNTLDVIAVARAAPQAAALIEDRPPPWFERWTTWAIVSGGLAAAGVGALWIALDARGSLRDLDRDSTHHEYAEAQALQQRFDRAQLVTDLTIGGAAVAAVAGTVLWLRSRHQVSVFLSPDAARIAWSARF